MSRRKGQRGGLLQNTTSLRQRRRKHAKTHRDSQKGKYQPLKRENQMTDEEKRDSASVVKGPVQRVGEKVHRGKINGLGKRLSSQTHSPEMWGGRRSETTANRAQGGKNKGHDNMERVQHQIITKGGYGEKDVFEKKDFEHELGIQLGE